MRENKGYFSFAFDSARVKYQVWPGPNKLFPNAGKPTDSSQTRGDLQTLAKRGKTDKLFLNAGKPSKCFQTRENLQTGPDVICGFSLLLVLYSAPRGFSLGTPVFPYPQKPTFPNSNPTLECTATFERVLWAPWCSVGKQIYIYIFFYCSQTRENQQTVSKRGKTYKLFPGKTFKLFLDEGKPTNCF